MVGMGVAIKLFKHKGGVINPENVGGTVCAGGGVEKMEIESQNPTESGSGPMGGEIS